VDVDINIEPRDGGGQIFASASRVALSLLRNAVEDIADRVERQVDIEVPESNPDAGTYPGKISLGEHPVERSDTIGGVLTGIPAFGGGAMIRGGGGRFVGAAEGSPGRTVVRIIMTLPEQPRHARWVHEGTGIFGPHASPIVPRSAPYLVFSIAGRRFKKRQVRGQEPNRYLFRAFEYVDGTFVPVRLAQLRAEIAAAT